MRERICTLDDIMKVKVSKSKKHRLRPIRWELPDRKLKLTPELPEKRIWVTGRISGITFEGGKRIVNVDKPPLNNNGVQCPDEKFNRVWEFVRGQVDTAYSIREVSDATGVKVFDIYEMMKDYSPPLVAATVNGEMMIATVYHFVDGYTTIDKVLQRMKKERKLPTEIRPMTWDTDHKTHRWKCVCCGRTIYSQHKPLGCKHEGYDNPETKDTLLWSHWVEMILDDPVKPIEKEVEEFNRTNS